MAIQFPDSSQSPFTYTADDGSVTVYYWDGEKWISSASGALIALDDLQDVETDGATQNQVLIYNGTDTWLPGDASTVENLDDLDDVNTSGATQSQVLMYNGTDTWVPGDVSTETPNLQAVTDKGSTTTNGITAATLTGNIDCGSYEY